MFGERENYIICLMSLNEGKKKLKIGKKKMQNVSFETVEDFLRFLPDHELAIVELIRKIIFSCIPDCTEKLSYNVPYFKRHSTICFIWPSSVTWGKMENRGVRVGFTKGYLMQDEINYLDKGKRKQVYWRDFYDVREVDIELLKAYIFEAAIIDEEQGKRKKRDKN